MSAAELPDLIEHRVIEYAPGKFAPVVAKGGKWEFTGGRVYSSHESASFAAPEEVDFLRRFWGGQLADRSNAVVVDGEHFRIGSQSQAVRRDHRGFGGHTFHLRSLTTGDVTTCADLWRQGKIPDAYRPFFPDSHEFVGGQS